MMYDRLFGLSFFSILIFTACHDKPLSTVDEEFDVSVYTPAYLTSRPKVLFDEGHENHHKSNGTYKPFANLIINDGVDLAITDKPASGQILSGFSLYIIVNAKGKSELNDSPAFTMQECDAVEEWVKEGGSLLLITDHFPFGSAVENLAKKFHVEMQKGIVQDSIYNDKTSKDESQLEFSRKNKLLQECELTKGIDKVISFTGQSIRCEDSCISFLNLSDFAYDMTAKTEVIKDGNDTRVNVSFVNPQSAKGRSQGVALTYGQGRVVVLGEAGMLTAQFNRDHSKFGMNVNADNKILALNIMHWLIPPPRKN